MTRWYYNLQGKQHGPVSASEVIGAIKAGQLTLLDLVFREGDDRWHAVGEIPEFKDAFSGARAAAPYEGSVPPSVVAEMSPSEAGARVTWVLLQKGQGEAKFAQSGPFTTEQILEMLRTGAAVFTDHVWRPGFKQWTRLSHLAEFGAAPGDINSGVVPRPAPSNRQEPVAHDRIERLDRSEPVARVSESTPDEADGPDLTSATVVRVMKSVADEQDEIENAATIVAKLSDFDMSGGDAGVTTPSFTPARVTQLNPSDLAEERTVVAFATDERGTVTGRNIALPDAFAGEAVASSQDGQGAPPSQGDSDSVGEVARDSASEIDPSSGIILDPFGAEKSGSKRRFGYAAAAVLVFLVCGYGSFRLGLVLFGTPPKVVPPVAEKPVSKPAPAAVSEPVVAEPERVVPPPVAANPASQSAPEVPHKVRESGGLPFPKDALPPGSKPTVLTIQMLRLNSARPTLAFETDTPVGQKIWLAIRGRSGDVLGMPSFGRTVPVIRASATEIPSIDLSTLGVPPGEYRVDVVAGDLRRNVAIKVGETGRVFEEKMEKYLKQISWQQQAEKKSVYYAARKFEALSKTLSDGFTRYQGQPSKWKPFYNQWLKDYNATAKKIPQTVTTENRNKFAYPEQLYALQQAGRKLSAVAQSLNTAILQKRSVASRGNLAITREFSRLKVQAGTLSSRKPVTP